MGLVDKYKKLKTPILAMVGDAHSSVTLGD